MAKEQRDPGSADKTSLLVIAARLILLLLACAAAVSAFALAWGRDHTQHAAERRYVCPMHPEVAASVPAECPICRMALERVQRSKPSASASAAAAPARSHEHGDRARGAAGDYVCPMHPEVTSQAPDDRCPICRMMLEPRQATDRGPPAPAAAPSFSLVKSASLEDYKVIGAAKRRALALELRAPAWLEADGLVTAVLYKHDLAGLSAGEQAVFFRAAEPTTGIAVRLTADPPAPWDGSTSRVHFRLDASPPGLGAREVGWVELGAKSRELLVVPSGAVLYSADGPYVLAASADGRSFSKRPVETGKVFRGLTVVLSGLHDGEPIAVGSAFSLDAERRLAEGHDRTTGVTR